MQCLPVKLQVSDWGAESNGSCLMTLEAVQDIKRGIRMSGVRTVRCHPTALLTNCSFPEDSKTVLLLNKIIKLFFKNLKIVLKCHHFSQSSVLI